MSNEKFKNVAQVIFLILSLLIPSQSGIANQAEASINIGNSTPGDIGWSSGFVVNGTDRGANVIAIDGNKIYVGGFFNSIGGTLANNIAMWDGTTWTALGNGIDQNVIALAIDGRGNLYAGGLFVMAGDTHAYSIARWDGQNWTSLGSGIHGLVASLAVDGFGNVYAGGHFDNAGGVEAHNIAKWDGSSWSALKSGISSSVDASGELVYTLAIDRFGFLYAGGRFTHADSRPANNIARWDGNNWSVLGDGITGLFPNSIIVWTLATDNRGNLFVGGMFDLAGDVPVNSIAKWNGENWSDVGGGVQSTNAKTDVTVRSLVADGGILYVGGTFDITGEISAGGIARWNGLEWENMNGGVWREGSHGDIYNLAIDRDGYIFATGSFFLAGGVCAYGLAVWDGSNWSGLGAETTLDGPVNTMIADRHGGYYFGGSFMCAGGKVVNHIAHWDGVTWSGLGSGLANMNDTTILRALALDQAGNLYVGGNFTYAGGNFARNIARWTGSNWEAIGEGLANNVTSLALDSQDNLFAGGLFYISGSNPPQYSGIARWDNNQWELSGTGFTNYVQAMGFDEQDRLVVGGDFSAIGEVAAYGIARWNGQSWEPLAEGFSNHVMTLLIVEETIYAGGLFGIWKFQAGSFESIGGGISSPLTEKAFISALTMDGQGRLVIGGEFEKAGQVVANNIARWDGQRWEALGSGFKDGSVQSLIYDASGKLLVGGSFTQVGGKVSRNLAIWKEPFYQWLPLVGN